MNTKTYNVNLKAKKTELGGELSINVVKSSDVISRRKSYDANMALIILQQHHWMDMIYPDDYDTMTKLRDEFMLDPSMDDLGTMFSGCVSLEEIDTHLFNTSNIKRMDGMFQNCASVKRLDLRHFDVSKVEDMTSMFEGCSELESLDFSGWDTSKVQNFNRLFFDCPNLKEIKGVLDLSSAISNAYCFADNKNNVLKLKIKNVPSGFNIKRTGLNENQLEIVS